MDWPTTLGSFMFMRDPDKMVNRLKMANLQVTQVMAKPAWPGRRTARRQTICSVCSIKDRIPAIHLHAEQLSWSHWMNIFTTKTRRHEAVPATAARPRILKNPWPAGLRTSCPPVAAVAPLFPPLPPVQISTIDNPFPTALCLCAVVVKIVFGSLIIVH